MIEKATATLVCNALTLANKINELVDYANDTVTRDKYQQLSNDAMISSLMSRVTALDGQSGKVEKLENRIAALEKSEHKEKPEECNFHVLKEEDGGQLQCLICGEIFERM